MTPSDDALEADLRALNLADRPVDPAFTARVLAALPAPAAVTAPRPSLLAWWQREAAFALVLAGLLIMLLTDDALTLLGNWWQEAGAWYTAATTTDGSSVGTLLGTLPGGNTAPETHLGLVIGAVLLALGAGVFVVKSISALDTPVPTTVALRRTRLV